MLVLILVVLIFLLGFLIIFPAPVLYLWYVAIIVSEFSWIFIIITVVLLFIARSGRYHQVTNIFGIATIVLYSLPFIQAYLISSKLEGHLSASFKTVSKPVRSSFSIASIFSNIGNRPTTHEILTYKDTGSTALTLDYYKSATQALRPCIVVIHGGSWKGGNSKQLPELNTYLANRGYHVASINYRLAPVHHSPAQYEDVKDAIRYLHTHATELNIDTTNFVLLGRSAGSQLALLAAYTIPNAGIRGVISYYGPADMVWGYKNPAKIYNSCEVLEDYIGGTYNQLPENYIANSPIEFVNHQTVPTLMIHGKNDVLVAYGHSTRLSSKLQQYNVPHYLLTLPWATHGCDYTLSGPSGQLSSYAVERFLSAIIK